MPDAHVGSAPFGDGGLRALLEATPAKEAELFAAGHSHSDLTRRTGDDGRVRVPVDLIVQTDAAGRSDRITEPGQSASTAVHEIKQPPMEIENRLTRAARGLLAVGNAHAAGMTLEKSPRWPSGRTKQSEGQGTSSTVARRTGVPGTAAVTEPCSGSHRPAPGTTKLRRRSAGRRQNRALIRPSGESSPVALARDRRSLADSTRLASPPQSSAPFAVCAPAQCTR